MGGNGFECSSVHPPLLPIRYECVDEGRRGDETTSKSLSIEKVQQTLSFAFVCRRISVLVLYAARQFFECTINFNTQRGMRVISVQTTDRSWRAVPKVYNYITGQCFSGFHVKFVCSF